jgi:alcohol-forming fatty acyl-CoA reductase
MNIILTGFTGFLGKVTLLHLFDKYNNDIDKVYLLIRNKKNVTPYNRFLKIVNNSYLKDQFLKYKEKIIIIEGNLLKKNLGIKPEVINIIGRKIDYFINCAASVKFDSIPKEAFYNNCSTISNILDTCKQYFGNLHKIIHTSTFYVNFPGKILKLQNLIELPIPFTEIIGMIKDGKSFKDINNYFEKPFANTYVLTKALGEYILYEYSKNNNIQIAIVRPSIIANSYQFPLEGWNDAYTAYSAINYAYGINLVNYIEGDTNIGLNIVPVDFVSENIISQINKEHNKKFIIDNAIVNSKNSPKFKTFLNALNFYNILNYKGQYIICKNKYDFIIKNFIFDYLPYKIMQAFCICNKKKYKQLNAVSKFSNISNIFNYYTHNNWEVDCVHKHFDLKKYHEIIIPKGINKFILKNNLSFYPILNCKNHPYFDISWILDKGKNYSLLTNISAYCLRKAFKYMFSEIYINIDKIIEIINSLDDNVNLVLCPTHRSYCDFLLISYILFELKDLGVKMPRIAATSDFKKIPIIGDLFENLGCFYVERGAGKSEQLNQKMFDLVDKGENIEFFIEGGRSRSRQFLPFKTGLIRGLQESGKIFHLLPITISYEKIPEQKGQFVEVMTNIKKKMLLSSFLPWSYKIIYNCVTFGNVYINFSEPFLLKPNDNPHTILPSVMREFQLNTISTDYHYKFPIYQYQNIQKTGLKHTMHSSILEEWSCMNHWIFKYLSTDSAENIWERLYIEKYNYLLKDDIISTTKTMKYHRKYFKYINYDIKYIIEYIKKKEKIDIPEIISGGKIKLGNIICNFVNKELQDNKILDSKGNLINNINNYSI